MTRLPLSDVKAAAYGSAIVLRDWWLSVAGRSSGRTTSAETLATWRAAGRPVPPPQAVKKNAILEAARMYRLGVLVETGTYVGDMVAATASAFDCVYSIELSTPLHLLARIRLVGRGNVRLIRGDSSVILRQLLDGLSVPCLFWLDGHPCGGITAGRDCAWPLLEELDAILSHPVEGHVVLIDDARYLHDGVTEYVAPSEATIRAMVREAGVARQVFVRDDILRILPGRPA